MASWYWIFEQYNMDDTNHYVLMDPLRNRHQLCQRLSPSSFFVTAAGRSIQRAVIYRCRFAGYNVEIIGVR